MPLKVSFSNGQLVVSADVPVYLNDSETVDYEGYIATPERTRQSEENSEVSTLALVFIANQLERIADAMEASVTAPPSRKAKGANDA